MSPIDPGCQCLVLSWWCYFRRFWKLQTKLRKQVTGGAFLEAYCRWLLLSFCFLIGQEVSSSLLSLSPATVIYCLHTWNQMDDELRSTVPVLELYIRYSRYLITATQKQCTHWYFLSLSCISALGYEGDYKYKEDNLSKLSGHHSSFDSQRSSVTRKRSPLARKNFIVFGGSTNECGMNNGKLFWLPGFVSGETDPYLHWRSYKVGHVH